MKKILNLIIACLLSNYSGYAITFQFAHPPVNANVCSANTFTINVSDVPVTQLPLTITIDALVMQGNNVVTLAPYPDCGVGLSTSMVSPLLLTNANITGANCQLVVSNPVANQSLYTFIVSIAPGTTCNAGSVSFNLNYDVLLDCSLIPQNFQSNQSLNLEQTCTIVNNSQNLVTIVPLPHILNAPTIHIPGNFGQITDMVFVYQNNGSAPIDMIFGFEDKYLLNCANDAYTLEGTDPVKYEIAGAIPPAVYNSILLPGVSNQITILPGEYLYIKQHIKITGCSTSCPLDRKVELTWQCANSYQNYTFCTACQQKYETQFVFDTEIPSFTVERIDPDDDDAEYNTQCFGEDREWRVRVTNTSLHTALPNIRVRLQNSAYGAAGLVVIYKNTIQQEAANTNCISCAMQSPIPSNDVSTSACYNGGLDGNSYGTYDIDITGLDHGEYLTFVFKTHKCCNSDNSLLGINKSFNQWTAAATATTICNTHISPSASTTGDDLALSATGNISTHRNTGQDIDLSLSFNPSYPTDFTVNTSAGVNYFIGTTNQVMTLGGMFGDDFDKQMFGYTATNQHVTGILKAQINCGKGLVVCSPGDITMEFTMGSSTIQVPVMGSYFPNPTQSVSTSNPNGCPECEASYYNFYFSLAAIDALGATAIEDFFNNAKLRFNLTPCCTADPVTEYDVTFSVLPNTACFTYTLPTTSIDLTCTATSGTDGCCWIPLAREGWHINVHCPGCRAPGIIVDDYRMRRNSFGFPDAGNDRIADNTSTVITPATLAAYEATIAPEHVNRDASVYGDELIDRLTAHFEPGDHTLIAQPCTDFFRGYHYTFQNTADCWTGPLFADMASKGINLDVLQLYRTITYSELPNFDISVISAELYIDVPCTNCGYCEECGDFDYINTPPQDPADWSTQFKITIPGSILNTIGNPFMERDPNTNEYLFSFHENEIHSPPSGVVITPFHGTNAGFNYVEEQQYRLVVKYNICGNKFSTSLYYPANSDLKFTSDITNKMWMTGGSAGYGFDLSNQNSHDPMPNFVYFPGDPTKPDMQNEGWAIWPYGTGSWEQNYCSGCNEIDQSFADDYKFYCETCGGSHTFYSTDITTAAAYGGTGTPSCDKAITITGYNSFARHKFETGYVPRDLFPFEYRPPALFPETWTLDYPAGYTFLTQPPDKAQMWSNYFFPNPTWNSVSYFSTIATDITIPSAPLQLVITPSTISGMLGGLTCVTGSIPANQSTGNLLIGDNYSSQSIRLKFRPDCTVSPAWQYFESGATPLHGDILFSNNTTGCNTGISACNYSHLQHNMNGPNVWARPNPHLEVDFAPSNTNAFTAEVCWPFSITNFPAPPPNATDPPYTDGYNIFIAAPTGGSFNGWHATYDYGTYTNLISNANANGIIGLLPNGAAPANFPLSQYSIITGEVCATYNPCLGTPGNNYVSGLTFQTGWNCEGIPNILSAACNQNYVPFDVTVTDLPVNIIVDNSLSVYPIGGVTLCAGTETIIAAFKNVDWGQTHPVTVNLNGANISGAVVTLVNCSNTSMTSPPLSGGGTSFTIQNSDLAAIGYSSPYMMGLNDCIMVKVEFTPLCPNAAGPLELPSIELGTVSYCGANVNSSAFFPPVPIIGCACNNCYGISKSYAPIPAIVWEPVTYTITVCSYNTSSNPSIDIQDVLPANFVVDPPITFPINITNLGSCDCQDFTFTGYFTDVNSICPNNDFTNEATLVNTGQIATVCSEVVCPDAGPNGIYVTADNVISSYSGNGTLTGATIQVADFVNLTIDVTFLLDNCTFIMGSGSVITIDAGVTLTISNGTVFSSCPKMWQGIRIRPGGKIDMKESTIKDAESGIRLYDNTHFEIRDSYFYDCVVGLETEANSSGSITGDITGTEFAKVAPQLKTDYPGQVYLHGTVGRAGILLSYAILTIGDNAQSENVFHDINFGIEVSNSDVVIVNNNFHDIIPDAFYSGQGIAKPFGCAITARGGELPSTINVFPLASGSTTIDNAPVGVHTFFYNARINQIGMTNVLRGVFSEWSIARTVNVSGCNINALYRGIDFSNNNNSTGMTATGNTIVVTPTSPAKGSACIYMSEFNLGNNANYRIFDNYHLETQSALTGIGALGVENAWISYNFIYTNPGILPPGTMVGILLNGGGRNTVTCNMVTNSVLFSNTATTGMQTDVSVGNRISCNNFIANYTGMKFNGICGGTTLSGNSMRDNFKGMLLNSNAEIGQQVHRGNLFIGNYGPNGNYGADNLNISGLLSSQITVHQLMCTVNGTNTYYYPKIPVYDFGINTWVPLYSSWGASNGTDNWFETITPGSPFDCGLSQVCLAHIAGDGGGKGDGYERMIASGLNETVDYKTESKAMAKEYLYESLSLNDTILQDDTLYQRFYNQMQNTDIGKLYEVKANLIDGKLTDALQVNQEVDPVEVPQANEKAMNEIAANTLLQGEAYAQTQIQNALAIAHQCPYSGGNAVYQARAFVETYYSQTEDYDDVGICLQQGIYKQGETKKTITPHDFTLHPNPASNQIVIDIKGNIDGICRIEIINNVGEVVLAQSYNCEQKSHTLDISNLTDGMYQVRVAFNNEYRFISKLAVIR